MLHAPGVVYDDLQIIDWHGVLIANRDSEPLPKSPAERRNWQIDVHHWCNREGLNEGSCGVEDARFEEHIVAQYEGHNYLAMESGALCLEV
jgi:hypothetical protein